MPTDSPYESVADHPESLRDRLSWILCR